MQAPWTRTHNISDKPARNPPEQTCEQLRPPHVTDPNCGSPPPQLYLQFNSYCGLESDSNHWNHFQRCFRGSDIILHCTENKSEFHKERGFSGRRVSHIQMHSEFTSSESPDITSAQSCFLLKALSSRWASPRVVTCNNGNHIYKFARAHSREKHVSGMTICLLWHPDCYQTCSSFLSSCNNGKR